MINISFEKYTQAPGINISSLSYFDESAAKFKKMQENPKCDTKSLAFGRLIHTLILERNLVNQEYAIEPAINKRTKAGKDFFKNWGEQAKGKQIVSSEDFKKACDIAHSFESKLLWEDAFLFDVMKNSKNELSWFVQDDELEVTLKGRTDIFWAKSNKEIIIADLKTTSKSAKNFKRDILEYKYNIKAAWYVDLIAKSLEVEASKIKFFLIALETFSDYDYMIYEVGQEEIDFCRPIYENWLAQYKIFSEGKEELTLGYPKGIQQVVSPQWWREKYATIWS